MADVSGDFAFTEFRSDDIDPFEEGAWPPTAGEFANAISLWSVCQSKTPTIQQAAKAFRAPKKLVSDAINCDSSWMYHGDIGEDGTPLIRQDGA